MLKNSPLTLFWMRRDLRIEDNAALFYALKENTNVLPVFIFDSEILSKLNQDDRRVQFIYDHLVKVQNALQAEGSDILVSHDNPVDFFNKIFKKYTIKAVYTNHDYEPQAITRDQKIEQLCNAHNIEFKTFKDHVIFEKDEVLSDQRKPYTVYTPYKKKWLTSLSPFYVQQYPCKKYYSNLTRMKISESVPTVSGLGFNWTQSDYAPLKLNKSLLKNYASLRDYPFEDHATSQLGVHLRFGTASIRYLTQIARLNSEVWLSELIWRDFFQQILWHHPHSAEKSFRLEYENIKWRNSTEDFNRWKNGETGYPIVDAGMRELNATGHMHNRVRMITASFLTKHLLHHWKTGERYFAEKLYDYDLAANVGNWQWAAGTGCDAAPYFRIFNPTSQQEKFDPDFKYIKKWVPEFGTAKYSAPMIEHTFARARCLDVYKKGLKK